METICEISPLTIERLRFYHEKVQLTKRAIFYDTVEKNPLTNEQRLGVIRSNDKNMVLAAAGTGKTSVMVAKALDLIDRGLAKPSEILVLAYNKKASDDLERRLNESAKKSQIVLESSPHIATFHALGRQILRDLGIPVKMSIFAEDSRKLDQWIISWMNSYIGDDPTRIFDFIEFSTAPVNPFNFETKAEYESYIRDNEFRTLNDELVKGYQELLIANFLYVNQIPYEYEAKYVSKRRIEIGFDYRPDFHLTECDIYIEHFGIDRKGRTRVGIDELAYNESIRKKRILHKEYGTNLLETFHYEWCEDRLLSNLKKSLLNEGVECDPMSPDELFTKINEQDSHAAWIELLSKSLSAIRTERLSDVDILERLEEANIHQAKKYSSLLNTLHEDYVKELQDQQAIDFDDMIIRSIQVIQDGEYAPKWKYVLVDEFQDISAARMEFINTILEKGPNPSLTVVGDDWQSIYRFSGGKLELTTRFDQLVGKCSLTKLQKSFRYNNSIANTAGQFIMENPEQIEKNIDTHTKVNKSQVYLLDDYVGDKEGVYKAVKDVVCKIRRHCNKSIAIIARYNYLLNNAREHLLSADFKDNIEYWSFHKSKGLEATYTILIGFFQGKAGFPNENRDDAVVEALLPSLDSYPHSEERRLLYVGITRAEDKCYIIADPTSPSSFINELMAPKYDLHIHSSAFQNRSRKIYKCPNCEDGYFQLRSGKFGDFYTCSSQLGCKVGKARICTECGSPSVDFRDKSVCNNISCGSDFRICDKCGRPMKLRIGENGEFWGCSGFGIMDDQCKNTVNI